MNDFLIALLDYRDANPIDAAALRARLRAALNSEFAASLDFILVGCLMPTNTTSSRAWRCTLCSGCGAGYGSDRQAADALRRHMASAHRRQLLQLAGGAR